MELKQTQILLEGYTSPVSKVIEIQPEGVLCESYKSNGIDDGTEESWPELY